MSLFLFLGSLSGTAAASGPYDVEYDDVQFTDSTYGRGRIQARVYYPADLAAGTTDQTGGPYPLIVMMHGWMGSADLHDELCSSLGSEGFVVASVDTQTGLLLDSRTFAEDALALVAWVEMESAEPARFLSSMVDGGDLIAMGHSLGGATLGHVVGLEPRVRTVVGFMPYRGGGDAYPPMEDFDGAALYIAGTDDWTAPTRMVEDWFHAVDQADRSVFMEIDGAGHQASTDPGWWSDGSLSAQRQVILMTDMATAFVRSEVHGEEDRWAHLVGNDAPTEQIDVRSSGHAPALWGDLDGDVLTVGVAGRPEGEVTFLAATDPSMANALEMASTSLVEGLATHTLAVDISKNLYLQALVEDQGAVGQSRVLPLITHFPPDLPTPGHPDPSTSVGGGDGVTTGTRSLQATGSACGGCQSGALAPFGPWWLLPLLWLRRAVPSQAGSRLLGRNRSRRPVAEAA